MLLETGFLLFQLLCFIVILLSVLIVRNYTKADKRFADIGDRIDSPLRKMCGRVIKIWTSVGFYALFIGFLSIVIEKAIG
jgi:uncharacterized membrane protein